LLADFPELKAAAVPREREGGPEITVALAASFTPDPVLDGLTFWFQELGVRGAIDVAPYGQILQTLLTPVAAASRVPRVQVVLLRVRDWLRELPAEQASSLAFVESYTENVARDFERAMRAHRAQSSGDTLLVFCPSAAEHPGDEEAVLERIETSLADRLDGLPGLTVVRARDHHATYGVSADSIADHVREHIAHIPYQAAYFHTLATLVMRHVHRKLAPARKLVVVDCDNTLWRGVVGEVGPEGVAFEDEHAALHETLTRLNKSGVLVALCSKNDEADVWRVFETRQDFGLSRDVIVAAMINWRPKSENLKALAARLNLGLDSLIFIDDNPVECAEVRAGCPDVLTVEWPLDPARAQLLLRHTWELDPRSATAEDQRRTELYREEFRRQEAQAQTLTFRDFIASLGLHLDIAPLAPADLKRSSQLTLRTNQFNFTTIRRDEGELQALAAAGVHEIRTVKVRDRFGDYGLVGLLIAKVEDDLVSADTFLLSCRVLGRGVEHQMAAELGRIAVARGASRVRMRVEPTKRNTPARSFVEAIVPEEYLRRDNGVVEADLPAAVAAAIAFEPADQAPAPIAEDSPSKGARPADASRLRVRESQIARTSVELGSTE
jgi:FkbH-like protein